MSFLRNLFPKSNEPLVWLASFAIVTMALGLFGGNRLIAASHVLVAITLIYGGFTSSMGPPEIKRISGSLWALVALVVAMTLSVIINWSGYDSPLQDFKKIRYELVTLVLCLFFPFRSIFEKESVLVKWVWWGGFGAAALITVLGILVSKTDLEPLYHLLGAKPVMRYRVGGVSGTVMTYAYSAQFFVLALVSVLTLKFRRIEGFCLVRGSFEVILCVLILLILSAGLFWSQSRGALLGALVGLGVLVFLARLKVLYVGAVILLVSLGIYIQTNSTRLKADPFKHETVRFSQWRAASLAFLDNPLFGLGHRQFEKKSADLKEGYRLPADRIDETYFNGHAHSNYLEAFASTGLLGGLSLLAFITFWFKEAWEYFYSRVCFIPIIVAFFVSGFFENTFTDSEVLHVVLFLYFLSRVVIEYEKTARTGCFGRIC